MRLKFLSLLAGIQAWLGLLYFFLLPADPKNSAFLGFSLSRLSMMALLLVIGLAGIALFFLNIYHWTEKTEDALKKHRHLSSWLENLFGFFFITGTAFSIIPILKPLPFITGELHQRILPLLVWFTLCCLEAGLLIGWSIAENEQKSLIAYFLERILGKKEPARLSAPTVLSKTYGWLVLILLSLAVIVPSSGHIQISGFPLSTWPEGLAVLLLIPLFFDSSLRSAWLTRVIGFYKGLKYLIPTVLALVIILKMIVFLGSPEPGFNACYRIPSHDPDNGLCELSFENPIFKDRSTRVDPVIDFDPNTWNLSFYNTVQHAVIGDPDNIERKRQPFQVDWTGTSEFKTGQQLLVEYAGMAEMNIGSASFNLPEAYTDTSRLTIQPPEGTQAVKIRYFFTQTQAGSNPIFRLSVMQENQNLGPLSAVPVATPWSVFFIAIDVVLIILLVILAGFYILQMAPAWRMVLVLTTLASAAWWALPELYFMPLMVIAFIWLILWSGGQKNLLSWTVLSILLWFRTLVYLHNPSFHLIRFDGTDMLTYESFAREILSTGTLRAGEDVFYYQALFRYVVYLLHIIFGESDMLRSLFVLLTLNFWVYLTADWFLCNKDRRTGWFYNGLGWVLMGMIVLLTNSSVVFLVEHGISESFSWLLFLFIFYCLVKDPQRYWLAASIMVGLAILNRYNHLPALLFVWFILLLPVIKKNKWVLAFSSLAVIIVLMLFPLHNWVYGQSLAIMPTSAGVSNNLIFTPEKIQNFFVDESIRAQVGKQILNTIGIVSWNMVDLGLPIFILFFGWIILGIALVMDWKSFNRPIKWLWLLPGLFLGVQFFYAMLANYPRHIYAAYLAIALVGMKAAWGPRSDNMNRNS